jgi:hypothetical protein
VIRSSHRNRSLLALQPEIGTYRTVLTSTQLQAASSMVTIYCLLCMHACLRPAHLPLWMMVILKGLA